MMMKTKPTKLTTEEVIIEISDIPQLAHIGYEEMPHYLFRKDGFYYCGHCGHRFGKAILNTCPHQCLLCQTPYVLKQITKRTNYRNLETHMFAQVLQKHDGRIVKRDYMIRHYVSDVKEHVSIDEVERETIYKGQCYQHRKHPIRGDEPYFNKYTRRCGEWSEGTFSISDYEFRMKKNFEFYPASLEEFLSDTDLKYSGVGSFADQKHGEKLSWYAMRYMREATRYPWVEYLYKLGMTNLYEEVISFSTDHRYVRPESLRRYSKFIRENNASTKHLIIYRTFEKLGLKLTFEEVKIVGDRENALKIIALNKITGMNHAKIIHYIQEEKKHKIGCGSSQHLDYVRLNHYIDYIEMMVKIGLKPDTAILAFPKDLYRAHDDAVGKFNALQAELETNAYKAIYENIRKLEFKHQELRILAPRCISEIHEEGKALNHCVGSYSQRVLDGTTIILFIRKTESPNTSFYTLEYRNKKIIQIKGRDNKQMSDEIALFVGEWEKWLSKKKKATVVRLEQCATV